MYVVPMVFCVCLVCMWCLWCSVSVLYVCGAYGVLFLSCMYVVPMGSVSVSYVRGAYGVPSVCGVSQLCCMCVCLVVVCVLCVCGVSLSHLSVVICLSCQSVGFCLCVVCVFCF